MTEHERLLSLAKKILNPRGQVEVSDLLDEGDIYRAKEYLQGAVDRLRDDREIGAFEAMIISDDIIELSVAERQQFRLRRVRAQ